MQTKPQGRDLNRQKGEKRLESASERRQKFSESKMEDEGDVRRNRHDHRRVWRQRALTDAGHYRFNHSLKIDLFLPLLQQRRPHFRAPSLLHQSLAVRLPRYPFFPFNLCLLIYYFFAKKKFKWCFLGYLLPKNSTCCRYIMQDWREVGGWQKKKNKRV